jgi:hypothetical protein
VGERRSAVDPQDDFEKLAGRVMGTCYRTVPELAAFQPTNARNRLVTNLLEPPPFRPNPHDQPPDPANRTSRARWALGCGTLIVIGVLPLAAILVGGHGASSRCVATPASASLMETISHGLTVSGRTLGSGYVVRSDDYDEVYFIAAPISGQGVGSTGSGTVGVWAWDLLPVETISSVNNAALEFSDWPDGTTSTPPLSMSDDGASEALGCVK